MVNVPEKTEITDLPFPHARIVQLIRDKAREGQYVRKDVYMGLNILLGRIAEDIADKVVETDNAYIEKHDLDRAARKYERIEQILKEKERVVQKLKALEADIERLARDVQNAGE